MLIQNVEQMMQNYYLQSLWKDASKNYEWMLNQREKLDEDHVLI